MCLITRSKQFMKFLSFPSAPILDLKGVNDCHVFDAAIGDLNVYRLDNDGTTVALWQMSGEQGDVWLQGQTDVSSSDEFQVNGVIRMTFFSG